jgi:branched-chain amino acid aminotransferase
MEPTKYIWLNGEFIAWDDAKIHVLTHTLHYGAGAFEGIRAYKTSQGPAIFRLAEHTDRLIYSSKAIGMELKFSAAEINAAIVELIKRNQLEHCYIRPLAYYGYGVMGLNPRNAPCDLMIACWPWGKYLPHEAVDIKISDFIRIHPKSTVADAKIVGHYVNSIMAVLEIKNTAYHEALLLDYEGKIAEGPGENIFIIKNGKMFTPKLGAILNGITRNTIFKIAKNMNLELSEKDLYPDDLLQADEAFFTGTAAEVTPIASVNDQAIGTGKVGELTAQIKAQYLKIVNGEDPEYLEYLTFCK